MSSGTTFAPPRWAKLIGQPRGVGGFGVPSLFAVNRPTAPVTSVPANAPRMNEPAPSRIWKMLSATMGESPCCLMIALLILEFLPARMGAVQSRGRPKATHTRSGAVRPSRDGRRVVADTGRVAPHLAYVEDHC